MCSHTSITILFLLSFCFSLARASCPAPLSLPIKDVSLSNGYSLRGIAVSIGQPAQELSFTINGALNDTWVWETGASPHNGNTGETICDNQVNPDECVTLRGGQYDLDASTSAQELSSGQATLTDEDTTVLLGGPVGQGVKDDVRLGDTALDTYAFGIVTNGFGVRHQPQNQFGLGADSTLLDVLKSAGKIASTTYSYYNGYTNPEAGAEEDGQIVFGGYDAAHTIGPNITRPIEASTGACPTGMWIDVEDLTLLFSNGSTPSITAGAIIRACVLPQDQFVMSLSSDPYWQRFDEYTNTNFRVSTQSPINNLGSIYDADAVYDGGLSISFGSGVTVNLTNEMLVTRTQNISTTGAITSSNSSAEVLVFPFSPANRIPSLGRQFFAAAQLFVDYEANTFTISPVAVTTDASQLVSVGAECAVKNSGTKTTANSASGNDKNKSTSALSSGAIAGIVIAAVAVLAIVAGAIWVLRKRRRRSQAVDSGPTLDRGGMSELEPKSARQELDSKLARQELDSKLARQELDASRETAELDSGRRMTRHELEGSQG